MGFFLLRNICFFGVKYCRLNIECRIRVYRKNKSTARFSALFTQSHRVGQHQRNHEDPSIQPLVHQFLCMANQFYIPKSQSKSCGAQSSCTCHIPWDALALFIPNPARLCWAHWEQHLGTQGWLGNVLYRQRELLQPGEQDHLSLGWAGIPFRGRRSRGCPEQGWCCPALPCRDLWPLQPHPSPQENPPEPKLHPAKIIRFQHGGNSVN